MKTAKLTEHLTYCGVQDPQLAVFDIIMETRYGTSYNSYLLDAGDKTVLFETAKATFADDYMATLRALTDPAAIDTLIVSHTEPDHVGSLAALLAVNPNLKVVGTIGAIGFLKQILNCEFNAVVVKDGDTMTIGNQTLRFMVLPNLHWPDTMYTYIEQEKALVTCDSFGAHYCWGKVLRSEVCNEEEYLAAAKFYFDCILAPFAQPFMQTALDRVAGMDVTLICPGHGPVLDSHIPELMEYYRTWVKPAQRAGVVVAYVSAYGYTKKLAQCICRGLQDGGVEARLYDLEEANADEVAADILAADGFLLGSPTILGDVLPPVLALTGHLHPPMVKGKPAAAFGSYGWSGEAVPNLTERLRQLKCDVKEGYRIRFNPSDAEQESAVQFGRDFAAVVKK